MTDKPQRRPTLGMVERAVTTILEKYLGRYQRMHIAPIEATVISLGVGFLAVGALALLALTFTLYDGATMEWYIQAPLVLLLWAAGIYALIFLYGEIRAKWLRWQVNRERERRQKEAEEAFGVQEEGEADGDQGP